MPSFSTRLKKEFLLLRNGLLELAEFVGKEKESSVLPRRFASSGLFLAFDRIFSHAFDYILYPAVIYYSCLVWELPSGFILGGFFMTVLSFLVCWLWVVLYDKFDVDLLVLEDLKRAREYKGSEKTRRMIASFLNKGDLIAFVVLSIKYDPFYAFAYKRKGTIKHNGIKGFNEWSLFLISVLISNVVWWLPSYFIGFIGFSALENFPELFEPVKPFLIQTFSCFLSIYVAWQYLILQSKPKLHYHT